MSTLSDIIARFGDCSRTEEYLNRETWVGSDHDGKTYTLKPVDLADAALLELAERCDALSRPEVALRMWKVRAEAAEATVIAKAAQVETLVKERRAERKRAEAAEADAEKWKLLAGERWVQCQHEAQMRDRAEAHVAELEEAAGQDLGGYWVDRANEAEAHVAQLERYLKAGREEWLLCSKALEQAEAEE